MPALEILTTEPFTFLKENGWILDGWEEYSSSIFKQIVGICCQNLLEALNYQRIDKLSESGVVFCCKGLHRGQLLSVVIWIWDANFSNQLNQLSVPVTLCCIINDLHSPICHQKRRTSLKMNGIDYSQHFMLTFRTISYQDKEVQEEKKETYSQCFSRKKKQTENPFFRNKLQRKYRLKINFQKGIRLNFCKNA